MNDQHKRSNITNRLMGSYQAQVVETTHPDGLYMVSVRLLTLWDALPDADLPFAEFLLPLGAKPNNGHAVPVEKGDHVWVDFPRNGDTRYPRITGSLYYAPDLTSHLPEEVNGETYQPKRSDSEPTPPAYDRKDDLYKRLGLREHKTHSGGWSITQISSGTAIEITPEGQFVIHTEGDQFQSATGNHTGQYGGNVTIKVKGNANIESGGALNVKAKGAATVETSAAATVKGSEITLKSEGNVNIEAGGVFAVKASAAPFTLG